MFDHWAIVKEYSKNIDIPDLNFEIMTDKHFQYFVDTKKYISNYTCINRTIYSFIFISVFIVYVEEKVRTYACKVLWR
jgi:hypothetical protein